MRIVDTQIKMHLSSQKFLDYAHMIFEQGRFISDEVKLVKELLNGEALYDFRVKGRMMPNTDEDLDIAEEHLKGVAQVMSYFCDKYGVLKGFILGELFFRKDGSRDDLLKYASVLKGFGGKNAAMRSAFYFWFINEYLQK